MKVEKGGRTPPLIDATAGGLAGAVARVVVGPLDVVKIRLQVQMEPLKAQIGSGMVAKYTGLKQAMLTILREEGIQGLWRGTVPGLMLTIPYTAVQFTALQQFHTAAQLAGLTTSRWGPSVSFLSGAGAGACATVASYPFDLLRTTLAAQGEPRVYRGVGDAARGILREQGISGLYRGLGVTLVEIIPYAALQFGLYDTFKVAYQKARRKAGLAKGQAVDGNTGNSGLERFLCGLAAGTAAKLGTHPLDVAKKRFQVAGLQRSTAYGARVPRQYASSLPRALAQIWKTEGLGGLYKGALPSVLKAAPQAAVTFSGYEFFLLALTTILHTRQ